MHALGFMLAAFAVGMLISVQPALNAILAQSVGSAYGAATVSIFVAFLCSLALLPFMGAGRITVATLGAAPWWVYFGGVAGMIFVAGGIVIAPVIGALLFFVCIIAGQLTGAALADHVGAFRLEVRELSSMRLAGLALVVAGAVIVQRG
ncbi:DMT family transporter [Histidinibacterium aquaticum]|uniref:DMT family transporter n=1 Tax=Histidinibacterium aquaticum TaxID=2613962 RepID=A0A5J5GFI2_9RHOB|nr:DMT family transporter [Histidinibacterium aquaticum]KAA9006770.1 DMT family transporter [Histidinibacterium aquaticum]